MKRATVREIGKRIHKYRTMADLTQEQLSEKIGISQKHLSRIEQGYHNPRFDMIIKIAKELHVPTDALARDIPDGDISLLLNRILPDLEKLNDEQLAYVEKGIALLAGNNVKK